MYRFRWFHIKHAFNRRLEKFFVWFVYKLPRWVIYWSAIRLIGRATTGEYSNQVVPELLAMDALKRWND